jgi:3-hydroxyisobutyrate dehydrogenase-like beta-hydroxyacid dehydrogenase
MNAGEPTPGTIGLIGLGLLGSALAARLTQAGFVVVGHDRDPARGDATLNEAGPHAVVLLCLPDSDVVSRVLDDLSPVLSPGQLLIDTTTGDPVMTTHQAAWLRERGVRPVDATVLGSSVQARAGDVVAMCGGTAEDVEAAQPYVGTFARRVVHAGPSGAGARLKLVVNLVLGLNRAVLAEGLAFAGRCGLDAAAALEVLRDGAAYSRVMDTKGEKMLRRDFTTQAKLSQHLKDVRLILAEAGRVGARVPLSEVHRELLERAALLGGDDDNSAVIRAYEG